MGVAKKDENKGKQKNTRKQGSGKATLCLPPSHFPNLSAVVFLLHCILVQPIKRAQGGPRFRISNLNQRSFKLWLHKRMSWDRFSAVKVRNWVIPLKKRYGVRRKNLAKAPKQIMTPTRRLLPFASIEALKHPANFWKPSFGYPVCWFGFQRNIWNRHGPSAHVE